MEKRSCFRATATATSRYTWSKFKIRNDCAPVIAVLLLPFRSAGVSVILDESCSGQHIIIAAWQIDVVVNEVGLLAALIVLGGELQGSRQRNGLRRCSMFSFNLSSSQMAGAKSVCALA